MAGWQERKDKECEVMFRTRLLSGIVLVAAALVFIISGGYVLLAVTALISLIGMYELYRVAGFERSLLAGIGYLAAILYYLNLGIGFLPDMMAFALAFLIVLLAVYVFSYPKYEITGVLAAFFGFFYVAVMLSGVYQTRIMEKGAYIVWLIFLCSWGCDTCAYCVGVLFGKHKMSPVLSPKKSVEGAVGGLAGTFLLTALYAAVFRSRMGIGMQQVFILAAISVAGGMISMVGDLAASGIKRSYGIKDYGKLIPGHGGILDRFDSVIFTAPVIYYLAGYFL